MSKYQDIMNKIEVTDEMKSRILQNIEKELKTEEAAVSGDFETKTKPNAEAEDKTSAGEDAPGKIRKFEFRKYMPMAAGLLVFILSTFLILNVIPHHRANESATTAPMADSESAVYETEAPMATETAAEAEMAEEAPAEAEMAAEAPAEAETEAEMAAESPADAALQVETNTAVQEAAEEGPRAEEAAKGDETTGASPSSLGNAKGESIQLDGMKPSSETDTAASESENAAAQENAANTEGVTAQDSADKTEGVTAPESAGKTEAVGEPEPITSPVETSAPKPSFFGRIAGFFRTIIEAIKSLFK